MYTPAVSGVLVLDFDGTVTTAVIGDAICDRFAPPAWREYDERWIRNELPLPDAQRAIWEMARATPAALAAFLASETCALRPGLPALVERARERGLGVWVASGGFDFYIDVLLGPARAAIDRFFCNRGRLEPDGRFAIDFPHRDLACGRCAVCKGRVCDRARADLGGPVLFVGDGHSDRCVIGHADRIAAVRGRPLAEHLAAHAVAATPFDRLDDLLGWL